MASEQTSGLIPSELREQSSEASSYVELFNQFIVEFAGHPVLATLPEMTTQHPEFGAISYDTLTLASFTRSDQLVGVREARRLPGDQKARYAVVTVDLQQGTITHWHVADVEHSKTIEGHHLELFLSHKALSICVSEKVETLKDVDPLRAILAAKRAKNKAQGAERDGPRIILTPQGSWFVRTPGLPESLSNISDLHYALQKDQKIKQAQRAAEKQAAVKVSEDVSYAEESPEASHLLAEPVTITAA